jgi:hypothetical protein
MTPPVDPFPSCAFIGFPPRLLVVSRISYFLDILIGKKHLTTGLTLDTLLVQSMALRLESRIDSARKSGRRDQQESGLQASRTSFNLFTGQVFVAEMTSEVHCEFRAKELGGSCRPIDCLVSGGFYMVWNVVLAVEVVTQTVRCHFGPSC